MMSCEPVARLVPEGLDRKLSPLQRLRVRLHVLMCAVCRRYRYQSHALHRLFVRYGALDPERLSDETRARIKTCLRSEQL